jgi:hypothetical protein
MLGFEHQLGSVRSAFTACSTMSARAAYAAELILQARGPRPPPRVEFRSQNDAIEASIPQSLGPGNVEGCTCPEPFPPPPEDLCANCDEFVMEHCICPNPEDPESPMCDVCLNVYPHFRSCRDCRESLIAGMLAWAQHYDELTDEALPLVTRSLERWRSHRRFFGRRTIQARLPENKVHQDVYLTWKSYYDRCRLIAMDFHERADLIRQTPLLLRLRDVRNPRRRTMR